MGQDVLQDTWLWQRTSVPVPTGPHSVQFSEKLLRGGDIKGEERHNYSLCLSEKLLSCTETPCWRHAPRLRQEVSLRLHFPEFRGLPAETHLCLGPIPDAKNDRVQPGLCSLCPNNPEGFRGDLSPAHRLCREHSPQPNSSLVCSS